MTEHEIELREREEIEMLLPWYVAGKLPRADHERVADYLMREPEMARQVALIRDEQAATIHANETIAAPSSRGIDDVLARIDADVGVGARRPAGSPWARIAGFFTAPSAPAVRWVTAAAAVVLILQAVAIGVLSTRTAPGAYQVASGERSGQATGGVRVFVRFAEGARGSEIAAALMALDGQIIGGPKPGGLFTVRLGSGTLSAEEKQARIAAAREKGDVFALVTPSG